MAHYCDYVDRIEIEYDYETERRYLVRVVNASWKEYSLDVMKEIEPNVLVNEPLFYYRNIEFCNMGGYLVEFPGEVYRYRYSQGKYTKALEDWQDCRCKFMLWCPNHLDKKSKENILEVYPDFEYVLKKMDHKDQRIDLVFELLSVWKQHPEIEGLIALGLYDVAKNKNLFRLTLPKRKQIIQWICKNAKNGQINLKLKEIQMIIKYKMTLEEYCDYKKTRGGHYVRGKSGTSKWVPSDIETWRYLKKKYPDTYSTQNITSYYYDYLSMCQRAGHNMEDPYWLYPNDVNKAHDKVMEELKNVQATASALKGNYLRAVSQAMADEYNTTVDGYDIFIPTDMETITKQCDKLYQCLIRNNYVTKVLNQEIILVFVWKNGEPVATAEVFYDKKLGQFYGDERGHREGKDCSPSEEVQVAFNKWLEIFEPKKAKAERNIKYYKGFHSIDKNNVYHTSFGNYSFEIGKTYATPFDDDEILSKGGQGCVSSERVFHFCESISEISRHYNPTCYCEIEALGPVVEYNGACLSNRIRIVRAISEEELIKIKKQEEFAACAIY